MVLAPGDRPRDGGRKAEVAETGGSVGLPRMPSSSKNCFVSLVSSGPGEAGGAKALTCWGSEGCRWVVLPGRMRGKDGDLAVRGPLLLIGKIGPL